MFTVCHHQRVLSVIILLTIVLFPVATSTLAQDGNSWLPANLAPITIGNADQLAQLVTWGQGSLSALSWSADGKTLAAGSSRGIWLYNAHDLDLPPHLIEAESYRVNDVLFSPVDNILVSASCVEPVRVWDVTTRQQIAALHEVGICPDLLAFSPDGTQVVTARPNKNFVELWPIDGVDHTEPLLSMAGHEKTVSSAAFSPDGEIVVSSDKETLRFWNAVTGAELAVVTNFEGSVISLVFVPETRLLLVRIGRLTHLWDVSSPDDIREVGLLEPSVLGIVFNAAGTMMATREDNTVHLGSLSVDNGAVNYVPHLSLVGHLGRVQDQIFSPDQELLATLGEDQTIRLWDVHTGEQVKLLAGYLRRTELAYSPDGSVLAIAGPYEGITEAVILLDADTGAVTQVIDSGMDEIGALTFSPDGALLAVGQGGIRQSHGAQIWDAVTGEVYAQYTDLARVYSLAFSPDGTLLAVGPSRKNKNVWVYNVQTHESVLSLGAFGNAVSSLAFSPDNSTLAVASSDETAQVWDIQTGEAIATLKGVKSTINSLVYSPDGDLLASAGWMHEIVLWDRTNWKARRMWTSGVFVRTLAFNPDGSLLAIAGRHHSIDLADVQTGTRLITLSDPMDDVTSVAFSPDGRVLATTGTDGVVRLWGVPANQ